MKKLIPFIIFIFSAVSFNAFAKADSMTVDLVRMFSKDIFETNGKPYLQPMVEGINATSNSAFFSTAYVPKKVHKPYYRVSIHGMIGEVPNSKKTYSPSVPMEQFSLSELSKYVNINWVNGQPQIVSIPDTAALAYYALKTIFYDAVHSGDVKIPAKSATILGSQNEVLYIPNSALQSAMEKSPAYAFLPANFKDTLLKYVKQFPEQFSLPKGADMSYFGAGIPQFEIGSLYGTEALIRFVPKIDMGKNIGKFAFWGLGLKHSISQYFYKEDENDSVAKNPMSHPLNLAVQAVYQGTSLKNKVGVTSADLDCKATFWDFNIQGLYYPCKFFNVYSSFSYEISNINAHYKYYIPWELQVQLGMVTPKKNPDGSNVIDPATGWIVYETTPEYPGDTHPQTSQVKVHDTNLKWVIGGSFNFGRFSIFGDYNMSSFNIFTAGFSYRF